MDICVNGHIHFSASGGGDYSYFPKVLLTLRLIIAEVVVAFSNKTMDSYSYIIAFYSDRNHIPWTELYWTMEYMTELVCTEITDHSRSLIILEGKKFQVQ